MIRVLLLVAAVTLLVFSASGCGGRSHTATGATHARTLVDLHSVDQLRTAFNTASDEPRLIVLVSPT